MSTPDLPEQRKENAPCGAASRTTFQTPHKQTVRTSGMRQSRIVYLPGTRDSQNQPAKQHTLKVLSQNTMRMPSTLGHAVSTKPVASQPSKIPRLTSTARGQHGCPTVQTSVLACLHAFAAKDGLTNLDTVTLADLQDGSMLHGLLLAVDSDDGTTRPSIIDATVDTHPLHTVLLCIRNGLDEVGITCPLTEDHVRRAVENNDMSALAMIAEMALVYIAHSKHREAYIAIIMELDIATQSGVKRVLERHAPPASPASSTTSSSVAFTPPARPSPAQGPHTLARQGRIQAALAARTPSLSDVSYDGTSSALSADDLGTSHTSSLDRSMDSPGTARKNRRFDADGSERRMLQRENACLREEVEGLRGDMQKLQRVAEEHHAIEESLKRQLAEQATKHAHESLNREGLFEEQLLDLRQDNNVLRQQLQAAQKGVSGMQELRDQLEEMRAAQGSADKIAKAYTRCKKKLEAFADMRNEMKSMRQSVKVAEEKLAEMDLVLLREKDLKKEVETLRRRLVSAEMQTSNLERLVEKKDDALAAMSSRVDHEASDARIWLQQHKRVDVNSLSGLTGIDLDSAPNTPFAWSPFPSKTPRPDSAKDADVAAEPSPATFAGSLVSSTPTTDKNASEEPDLESPAGIESSNTRRASVSEIIEQFEAPNQMTPRGSNHSRQQHTPLLTGETSSPEHSATPLSQKVTRRVSEMTDPMVATQLAQLRRRDEGLFQVKLKGVQDELATFQQRCEVYKDEMNSLKEINDQHSSALEAATTLANEYRETIAQLREEQFALMESSTALEKDLSHAQKQCTKLEEDLRDSVLQNKDLKNNIAASSDSFASTLMCEREASESRLSKLRDVHAEEIRVLQEKHASKNQENIKSFEKTLANLRGQLEQTRKATMETTSKINQTQEREQSLVQEYEELQQKCVRLAEENDALLRERAELREAWEQEHAEQLEELRENIARGGKDRDSEAKAQWEEHARILKTEAETRMQQLRNELKAAREEIAQAYEKVDSEQKESSKLNETLRDVQHTLDETVREHSIEKQTMMRRTQTLQEECATKVKEKQCELATKLSNAQATHETKLRALMEEWATEKQAWIASNRDETNALKATVKTLSEENALLQINAEMAEKKACEQEQEHQATLQALRGEQETLLRERAELREAWEQEHAEQLEELRENIARGGKDRDSEAKAQWEEHARILKTEAETRMQQLRNELKAAREEIAQAYEKVDSEQKESSKLNETLRDVQHTLDETVREHSIEKQTMMRRTQTLQEECATKVKEKQCELATKLSNAQATHETKLRALMEEWATEKQAWIASNRDETNALKATVKTLSEENALLQINAEMAEKKACEQEQEHQATLQALRSDHERATAALIDQHTHRERVLMAQCHAENELRAKKWAEQQHEFSNESVELKNRVGDLFEQCTEYERALKISQKTIEEKEARIQTIEESLRTVKSEHAEKFETMEKEHESSIEKLKREQSERMELTVQRMEEEFHVKLTAHAEQITVLEQEHAKHAEENRKDHELKRAEHAQYVQLLQAKHAQQISALQMGNHERSEVQRNDQATRLANLQREHEEMLSTHERTIADLKEVYNGYRAKMEDANQTLASEKMGLLGALHALKLEHEGTLEAQKVSSSEIMLRVQGECAHLKDALRSATGDLEKARADAITAKNAKRAWEQEHEDMVRNFKNQHESFLEQLTTERGERMRLEKAIEALKQERDTLDGTLRAHREEQVATLERLKCAHSETQLESATSIHALKTSHAKLSHALLERDTEIGAWETKHANALQMHADAMAAANAEHAVALSSQHREHAKALLDLREDYEKQLLELRAGIETAKEHHARVQSQLQREEKALSAKTAQLDSVVLSLENDKNEHKDTVERLMEEKARMVRALDVAKSALKEQQRAHKVVVSALQTEKTEHKNALSTQRKARRKVEKELAEAKKALIDRQAMFKRSCSKVLMEHKSDSTLEQQRFQTNLCAEKERHAATTANFERAKDEHKAALEAQVIALKETRLDFDRAREEFARSMNAADLEKANIEKRLATVLKELDENNMEHAEAIRSKLVAYTEIADKLAATEDLLAAETTALSTARSELEKATSEHARSMTTASLEKTVLEEHLATVSTELDDTKMELEEAVRRALAVQTELADRVATTEESLAQETALLDVTRSELTETIAVSSEEVLTWKTAWASATAERDRLVEADAMVTAELVALKTARKREANASQEQIATLHANIDALQAQSIKEKAQLKVDLEASFAGTLAQEQTTLENALTAKFAIANRKSGEAWEKKVAAVETQSEELRLERASLERQVRLIASELESAAAMSVLDAKTAEMKLMEAARESKLREKDLVDQLARYKHIAEKTAQSFKDCKESWKEERLEMEQRAEGRLADVEARLSEQEKALGASQTREAALSKERDDTLEKMGNILARAKADADSNQISWGEERAALERRVQCLTQKCDEVERSRVEHEDELLANVSRGREAMAAKEATWSEERASWNSSLASKEAAWEKERISWTTTLESERAGWKKEKDSWVESMDAKEAAWSEERTSWTKTMESERARWKKDLDSLMESMGLKEASWNEERDALMTSMRAKEAEVLDESGWAKERAALRALLLEEQRVNSEMRVTLLAYGASA